MGEWVLVAAVLAVLVFCFFLTKRLDKFIDENRCAIEKENEAAEPSCVMLTEELSAEEITAEILRFKNSHKKIRVILYDSSDTELQECMEYYIER